MVMLMKATAHFTGAGHARLFDPEAQPYWLLQVWKLIWNVPLDKEESWDVKVQAWDFITEKLNRDDNLKMPKEA